MRDLGDGFPVRRALPHGQRQMVGPFIFFDQMGPVQFVAGQGMDVRPHPHIGLATVTYLFDGRIMHRDSEGHTRRSAGRDEPDDRGARHRPFRAHARRRAATGSSMLGIQSWIALPRRQEEIDADLPASTPPSLPIVEDERRARARDRRLGLRGSVAGRDMLSEWFYVEVSLEAGASAPLDADHEERAIYVVDGEVEIAGDTFEGPRLLIFRPGDRITVRATTPARMMFLGGAAMEGPRYIWWNFVSSSKERIEQAKEDWKSGRFARCPARPSSFRCRSDRRLQ